MILGSCPVNFAENKKDIKSRRILNIRENYYINLYLPQCLFIPERISFPVGNILPHIHPESNKKVDNNRTAKGKKGQVNKVKPDCGRSNIEFFTQIGTNAKNVGLNEFSEFFLHASAFYKVQYKDTCKWLRLWYFFLPNNSVAWVCTSFFIHVYDFFG